MEEEEGAKRKEEGGEAVENTTSNKETRVMKDRDRDAPLSQKAERP